MSLHPIRVLDQVLDEYRDYLLTEFHARDENLRQALLRELEAPGFLIQEPFYQSHRPFKDGKRWQDLRRDIFIRDRLRRVNPPWRVEELKAKDLSKGQDLVTHLIS